MNCTNWKFTLTMIAVALLNVTTVSAAPQANVTKLKDVQQGSSITLQITTDAQATMPGTVSVQIMPPDGGQQLSASSSSFTGKTVSVPVTVPLNAATGSWRVMRVTFHPSAGGPKVPWKRYSTISSGNCMAQPR